jgi:hypothetical protein
MSRKKKDGKKTDIIRKGTMHPVANGLVVVDSMCGTQAFTWAEYCAWLMFGNNTDSTLATISDIHEGGNRAIVLAERIKSERAAITLDLSAAAKYSEGR